MYRHTLDNISEVPSLTLRLSYTILCVYTHTHVCVRFDINIIRLIVVIRLIVHNKTRHNKDYYNKIRPSIIT